MEINRGGEQTRLIIDDEEFATSMARRICTEYIPEFMNTFIVKNRKYRKVTNNLGAKGVFPDINRKVGIIEARVWDGDGEPDKGEGESTIEVIDDLIGHLLIMRDMLLQDDLANKWDGTVGRVMVMPDGPSVIERQNDGHVHEWDSLSNCVHCGKPGVGRIDKPIHTRDLLPDTLGDAVGQRYTSHAGDGRRAVKDNPQA